jgi:hypothetical protein
MVKEVIGFAHASLANTLSPHQYRIKVLQRGDYICLGPLCPLPWSRPARSIINQQSKQKTNNDQQIAAFQITNPGKNAALALIKQIHVMQFYITKDFT